MLLAKNKVKALVCHLYEHLRNWQRHSVTGSCDIDRFVKLAEVDGGFSLKRDLLRVGRVGNLAGVNSSRSIQGSLMDIMG